MFSISQSTYQKLESSNSILDIPTFLTTKPNQKRWRKALAAISCSRALSSLLPSPLLKPNQKRWRKAFAAISCSRALSSPLLKPKSIPHVSSNGTVIIDVFDPHPHFPEISQSSLAQLVKQKDLHQLRQFGGVEGLASVLKTKLDDGIQGDEEDISRRHEAFGPNSNTYQMPSARNLFYFVWQALRDPTSLALLVLSALSLGFGIKENGWIKGWDDGGSMFVSVLVGIAFSAIRNFRKNKQLVRISKVISNIQVDVVRSGTKQQVSIFEIVVGDVVYLKIGDLVPADGLFINGHSVVVEESSMTGVSDQIEVDLPQNPGSIQDQVPADGLLIDGHSSLVFAFTGESDAVKVEHTQNPFLFSGTKIADGSGQMLVTAVGMNTTLGEMMSTVINDSNEKTPLQSRLNKLTSSMRPVALLVLFLVLVISVIQYFIGHTKNKDGTIQYQGSKTKARYIINSILGIIAAAVSIGDVGIPQRLPWAVTVTLGFAKRQMKSEDAVVRKISACETMGFVTTICTDKTGTLTLNQMKVTNFWLGQDFVNEIGSSSVATSVIELLNQGVGLNTTGSIYKSASRSDFEFSGSPTEKAILSWAISDLNLDMVGLKHNCEILHVETFNSTKKRSGVLIRKNGENATNVHWKGAPETILAMCSNYYDISGNIKVLDDVERTKFDGIIQGMAASSLRCIAFAHKQVPKKENVKEKTQIEENYLTLLGLVGLKDPGVKKAVEMYQYAGVNVKMITGNSIIMARTIATECGILKPNQDMASETVVEGVEFRNYTHDERMEKVDKICVMARSSPFDKHLMIQCLKQKGHVVAVTGDGTNYASALKEANSSDIVILDGSFMEIQGTKVAKESSNIVIFDGNFGSVVTVLRWGRGVYTNIQKFFQFRLTVNVAALVTNSINTILARGVPLSAVQLLWVNTVMDTLGALALATEKPKNELMEKPPVGQTEALVTNVMWRNLVSQACYQTAVLLTFEFKGESVFKVSSEVNDTMIFNVFVLLQVFNLFNARKLEKKNVFEGIHKNKLFLVIIGVTIVLQVVTVEFLKNFADVERLNWCQWGVCVGFASVSWPIGWVVKWIPVPEKPLFSYLKWGNSEAMEKKTC